MGLKAVINSLDGLSEEIQALYEKSGDSYVLSVDDVTTHPTVLGLSNSVKAVRTEKKTIEKQLEDLQKKISGVDLDRVKDIDLENYEDQLAELNRLKQKEEEQQTQKLKDEKEWEKLERQLAEQHSQKVKAVENQYTSKLEEMQKSIENLSKEKETELGSMYNTLKSNLKDKELTAELAKANGNIPVLMPHISPYVEVEKSDNGDYRAIVVDKEGTPRINNTGQPMTIGELVSEFKGKPEFQGDGLFKIDTKPGGSGSEGNRGVDDKTNNPFAKDSWNLTQQAKLRKSDPQKYETLKKAAAGEV